MKKEIQQPRLDFYQILFRRKWNVKRWLESESITTKEQLNSWMSANENSFTYSESFLTEADDCFVSVETIIEPQPKEEEEELPPQVVVAVPEEVKAEEEVIVDSVLPVASEEQEIQPLDTSEEHTKKKNNKKKVQTGDDSE